MTIRRLRWVLAVGVAAIMTTSPAGVAPDEDVTPKRPNGVTAMAGAVSPDEGGAMPKVPV